MNRLPLQFQFWCFAVFGFCISSSILQGNDVALKTPLHTFAGEFLDVVPGTREFPATIFVGSNRTPSEQPVHEVTFNRPFRISKFEVWQDLYESVMKKNPSRWKGSRNSVEQISWHEAVEFCRLATMEMRRLQLIAEDEEVRLPTEFEWEYCCRAGTSTPYSFGDEAQNPGEKLPVASILNEYAWHTGNAAGNDPAVGVLKPNPWGLFDMHGYLWEYCSDPWSSNYEKVTSQQPDSLARRCVLRGGSWKDPADRLTSTYRIPWNKTDRSDAVGFRCVISKVAVNE
ncbi:formylglycine-generating enzyme family protein [Planctomicrobium sp. SH668]|uniref:formylglycine-generating enzyme family protein n=1 Tax=Planctomicrobium sp. SH668 TaxID=3448126 RepID=UPI003F5B2EAF